VFSLTDQESKEIYGLEYLSIIVLIVNLLLTMSQSNDVILHYHILACAANFIYVVYFIEHRLLIPGLFFAPKVTKHTVSYNTCEPTQTFVPISQITCFCYAWALGLYMHNISHKGWPNIVVH